MSLAPLLLALFVTTAAESDGDPVLLDFHASWCGPCQEMRPAVDKLQRAGYPLRSIDVDRSPEVAERYRVKNVPTYIVVDAQGKTLARTAGAMPAAKLAEFYNQAKAKLGPQEAVETASSRAESSPDEASRSAQTRAAKSSSTRNPLPWETVVRIKMHLSSQEWGFGSGTIIYSDPDQSIILTCAHIFKLKGQRQPQPREFRVPITVDLFDGHLTGPKAAMVGVQERDILGEAIDYDFNNDVGLIRIRPGRKLPASQVVPDSWKPRAGMQMYAVGCSHGADATAWNTTILDPQVNMKNTQTNQAFFEMKCSTQPMEGRSGGGLYTRDGYVAGVCDFADPNEHVGLYAVPQAIHRMLDNNMLTALYKPTSADDGTRLASNSKSNLPSSDGYVRAQSPSEPEVRDPITLPKPQMAGIPNPKPVAKREAGNLAPWGGRAQVPLLASEGRPKGRPTLNAEDASIDPNAPIGGPQTTDVSREPEEDASPVPRPAPRQPAPSIPSDPSRLGRWQPVRHVSSE